MAALSQVCLGSGEMVRARAWLVIVPILLVGSEFGQWLLDLFAPASYKGADVWDRAGFGLRLVPLLIAATAVLIVAGMLLLSRKASSASFPRRVLAAAPLFVFAVQEHLEYLLGGGARPWSVDMSWAFWAGLLLQLPLIVVSYLVARVLIRVAVRLPRRRPPVTLGPATSLPVAPPNEFALPVRARFAADARFNRGPPPLPR